MLSISEGCPIFKEFVLNKRNRHIFRSRRQSVRKFGIGGSNIQNETVRDISLVCFFFSFSLRHIVFYMVNYNTCKARLPFQSFWKEAKFVKISLWNEGVIFLS